jgi:sugar (pentulose or hexulose) kinase
MGSSVFVPLLVSLIGSSGLMGAIVALVKLRGDRDSVVVAQAHGANEAIIATLAGVERERDYWRKRYEEQRALNDQLRSWIIDRPGAPPPG